MPKSNRETELLTEKEVAEICRTCLSTVKYWRQVGKLKFFKPGRHALIRKSDLDAFIEKTASVDS